MSNAQSTTSTAQHINTNNYLTPVTPYADMLELVRKRLKKLSCLNVPRCTGGSQDHLHYLIGDCAHSFCSECSDAIIRQRRKCPVCSEPAFVSDKRPCEWLNTKIEFLLLQEKVFSQRLDCGYQMVENLSEITLDEPTRDPMQLVPPFVLETIDIDDEDGMDLSLTEEMPNADQIVANVEFGQPEAHDLLGEAGGNEDQLDGWAQEQVEADLYEMHTVPLQQGNIGAVAKELPIELLEEERVNAEKGENGSAALGNLGTEGTDGKEALHSPDGNAGDEGQAAAPGNSVERTPLRREVSIDDPYSPEIDELLARSHISGPPKPASDSMKKKVGGTSDEIRFYREPQWSMEPASADTHSISKRVAYDGEIVMVPKKSARPMKDVRRIVEEMELDSQNMPMAPQECEVLEDAASCSTAARITGGASEPSALGQGRSRRRQSRKKS